MVQSRGAQLPGKPVHVVAARLAIERGAGIEVIEQAIQQIAAAAAVLKGQQATDIVLERLRSAR